MGFEPTRAEPIGLAVQRLNHSATSSHAMRHSTSGITIHLLVEDIKVASAGNRTRINCLEGSYAHHYTTSASCFFTKASYPHKQGTEGKAQRMVAKSAAI